MKALACLAFGSLLVATACGGAKGGVGDGGGGSGGAACAVATTEADCNALPACHVVYTSEPRVPVGSCGCPDFGCCTYFSACAAGAQATCAGPVLCKVVQPYCEPGYSVANDGSCYVGCVMSSDCAP